MAGTETDLQFSIEGDWNGFEFRMVKPDDALALSAFFRLHYFPYEPVCNLTGYSDEFIKDNERDFTSFLHQGLSFMAVHKESGKIAGVRLAYNHTRADRDAQLNSDEPLSREQEGVMMEFKALDAQSNNFEKYGVDNFMELSRGSVAAEFRRNGLMTEMYRRSIALAKRKGFKLIGVNFTSPYARKAAAKVGFQEVARICIKDLYDSEGKPYYPQATEENITTQSIYLL